MIHGPPTVRVRLGIGVRVRLGVGVEVRVSAGVGVRVGARARVGVGVRVRVMVWAYGVLLSEVLVLLLVAPLLARVPG